MKQIPRTFILAVTLGLVAFGVLFVIRWRRAQTAANADVVAPKEYSQGDTLYELGCLERLGVKLARPMDTIPRAQAVVAGLVEHPSCSIK